MKRVLVKVVLVVPIVAAMALPGAVANAAESSGASSSSSSAQFVALGQETSGPHLSKGSCETTRRHHARSHRVGPCYEHNYRWYFDYWT